VRSCGATWKRRIPAKLRPAAILAALVGQYGACALTGSYQAMALRNRACARANSSFHGQADAIATLIRRTLTRTRAPSFSSFSRMVPQVASANCVCASPMRRKPHNNT
jgi:hypothetical protein